MTSQGQRFRRRALRRGYKVDEVDAFLDRVEATLAGDPVGAPVAAQEVHDVVFRVRFGGYDEWQVDLHLDRVERQLAELEERSGGRRPRRATPGCGWPRRGADRMPADGPPDRMPRRPRRMRPAADAAPADARAGRPARTAATTSRPVPSPVGTTPPRRRLRRATSARPARPDAGPPMRPMRPPPDAAGRGMPPRGLPAGPGRRTARTTSATRWARPG